MIVTKLSKRTAQERGARLTAQNNRYCRYNRNNRQKTDYPDFCRCVFSIVPIAGSSLARMLIDSLSRKNTLCRFHLLQTLQRACLRRSVPPAVPMLLPETQPGQMQRQAQHVLLPAAMSDGQIPSRAPPAVQDLRLPVPPAALNHERPPPSPAAQQTRTTVPPATEGRDWQRRRVRRLLEEWSTIAQPLGRDNRIHIRAGGCAAARNHL